MVKYMNSEPTTVAIIGIGEIGTIVAENLTASDFNIYAYDLVRERAMSLDGVKVTDSVDAAIEASRHIVLCLPDARSIDQALFPDSRDEGRGLKNKIFSSITTTTSAESRELSRKVAIAGGYFLDVAILCHNQKLRSGNGFAVVSGSRKAFEVSQNVLKGFGAEIEYFEQEGAAKAIEVAQATIHMNMIGGFGLALETIKKEGVDLDLFVDTVKRSDFAEFSLGLLQHYSSRIRRRDFGNPVWKVAYQKKLMNLIINYLVALGLRTDILRPISDILDAFLKDGRGEEDFTAASGLMIGSDD